MVKYVIYVLALYIASIDGRIAYKDEPIPDLSNNSLNEVVKTNVTEIHIDLPTISPNDTQTTTETVLEVKNETVVANTTDNINCTDITNNLIDSNEQPCQIPEDVGTALILTKFIKENRLEEARNASRVNPELFLGVESYSGFFTVNETYNSNLFFWYFPVEGKPVNGTPWIIWLQGGPGASSMTGLFDEIGPFRVISGETLIRNQYSWLRNHSLLFIENPVGTGFSFTDSEDGYVQDRDTYGKHLYSALRQFLQVFPELRTAPLFIAGESYAGKYLPALAMHLHLHKDEPGENVNLKGLMAGNAYIDPAMIAHMERPFYYFGLMETEQIEIVKPLIEAFQQDIAANRSVDAKFKWNHLITALLMITHQKHAYNFLRDELAVGRYNQLLHSPQVKRALHVGNIKFSFVNMTVNVKLNPDFLSSATSMYEELLNHYRVLTFCGQLDQMLSCVPTSENYRTWRWNGSEEFLNATRYPYFFNSRVAGYHKSGGRLTEVVVRGAGHMAPMDAPAPMQQLIARWTHEQTLGQLPILDSSFLQDYVKNNSVLHYL